MRTALPQNLGRAGLPPASCHLEPSRSSASSGRSLAGWLAGQALGTLETEFQEWGLGSGFKALCWDA